MKTLIFSLLTTLCFPLFAADGVLQNVSGSTVLGASPNNIGLWGTNSTDGSITNINGGTVIIGGTGTTNYFGANVNVNGTVNATGYTNSSLTASRIMLTDANKAQSSAAASGAVPIDADGSATTFAQVNALAPGYVVTNANANIFNQVAEMDLTGTTNYVSGNLRVDGGISYSTNLTAAPNFNKSWSMTNVAAAYTMAAPIGVSTALLTFQQTLYTITNTSGSAILVTLPAGFKESDWWGTNVTAFYVTNATTAWVTCRPGETNIYIARGY